MNTSLNLVTPSLNLNKENTDMSSLAQEIALLNERAAQAMSVVDLAIILTNKIMRSEEWVAHVDTTHIVSYKDARGVTKSKEQKDDDVYRMMSVSSMLKNGHTSQTGLASLFLDHHNRAIRDEKKRADKDSAVYKAFYSLANKYIWDLEKAGYITKKTEMVNVGDKTAMVKKLTPEFAVERAEIFEELRSKQATMCRPLNNVPLNWTSNQMGIHELSTLKLMPKVTGDRAIPNRVLNGINPLMRVKYTVSEDMKDHAQELVDNWDTDACWPGSDKLIKLEDVRMLTEFATMSDDDVFFMITLDLRGRMYYRGGLCTPQGNDFLKGAFQFKDRVALGGGYSTALVTLANACGYDKLSIARRTTRGEKIAHYKYEFLEDFAADYGDEDLYQAWAAYQEIQNIHAFDGDRAEYMSNLVCHRDGTCNGIQHMAAITKCEKTAQAVNLRATSIEDIPEDLYKNVAETALSRLSDADKLVLEKYGRKLTKKAVMVKSYGAGDDTAIAAMKEVTDVSEELSKAILDAIKIHASSVHKFVNALKSRVKRYIEVTLRKNPEANIALEWHTPDGFRVKIDYRDDECFTIRHHDNEGYSAKVGSWSEAPLDAVKTRGALAPNFIHSLDACHLRMVVSACADEGIQLATVHDSIGCHAGNAHTVDRIIREQFVEMHKTSHESLNELCANLNERPCKWTGKYNLEDALESTYIFS